MEKNKNINVIKDLNGKDIVLINDIKFKGKRSINWDDANGKKYLYDVIKTKKETSNPLSYWQVSTYGIKTHFLIQRVLFISENVKEKNPLFDAGYIRKIIKNPVYCGKIAYGRRRTEKVLCSIGK